MVTKKIIQPTRITKDNNSTTVFQTVKWIKLGFSRFEINKQFLATVRKGQTDV